MNNLALHSNSIRKHIHTLIRAIIPYDDVEQEHINDTCLWIESRSPIFRIQKPDVPNKHLVSYFVLFNDVHQKKLLCDHKKALLWLPSGGHVEIDENKILDELKSREPIFHHPEKFGKTKEDIENQMCDEFWEVGASGNLYTKQDVIETLLERYNDTDHQDIWEAKDFELTKIAPDNYLLTYILIQDKTRVTRRSTLWRKKNGDWKILNTCGTVIDGGNI